MQVFGSVNRTSIGLAAATGTGYGVTGAPITMTAAAPADVMAVREAAPPSALAAVACLGCGAGAAPHPAGGAVAGGFGAAGATASGGSGVTGNGAAGSAGERASRGAASAARRVWPVAGASGTSADASGVGGVSGAAGASDGGAPQDAHPSSDAGQAGAIAGDTFLPWAGGAAYYKKWSHGPPSDSSFYPIGVWLQSPPERESSYKNVGINLFVGLYEGQPTRGSPSRSRAAGVPDDLRSERRMEGAYAGDATIRGWLQPDEFDNAQDKPNGARRLRPLLHRARARSSPGQRRDGRRRRDATR